MRSSTRIILAFAVSTVIGIVVSLSNGREFEVAVRGGFNFAIIATAVVAFLCVGKVVAESKGYPGWVGLLTVAVLNVPGLILLLLLPTKTETHRSSPDSTVAN